MESKKRPHTTNNNSYKARRICLSSSIQPEDLCELGVDILSDEDSETTSIYDDYDQKVLGEELEETKKVQSLHEVNSTFRRKSAESRHMKVNLFDDLPDELVMGILWNLDKKSLVSLAMTCHRFYRLCRDEGLWPRLNLTSKRLDVDHIGHVLALGVKVLKLNSVIFTSPILSPAMTLKLENFVAKVKYLDLSYAWIEVHELALLLSKMRFLAKLSLESVKVNVDVIKALVNNKDLDTLNLAMATGLNHGNVILLAKNLSKLESLNLAWTGLEPCAYSSLCNELTPRIRHLDISGSHLKLKNDDLVSLAKRCPFIESLDISDCLSVSLGTFREILKNLLGLKFLGISRCYQLGEGGALLDLKKARKLEALSAYKLISDSELERVRAELPYVKINRNPLSVIARPTVGIRRTSIWERPTTD